jgi:hypothetical protein
MKILTSDSPLKETVLGVFDLAEIVAGGSTAAQKPKKKVQISATPSQFFGNISQTTKARRLRFLPIHLAKSLHKTHLLLNF